METFCSLSAKGNIVNTQNRFYTFSRKSDCTGANKNGLQNIFTVNIGGSTTTNTDTRILLSTLVAVAQVSDNVNAVKASVLSQRSGNNFQSLGKLFPAESLSTVEGK